MATINEDYVSLEIAKLLKEKGFDEATNRYYNAQHDQIRTVSDTFLWHWNDEEFMKRVSMDGAIAIPTLQMAMKWLREVHNVFISVSIGNHKKDNRDTSMPDFVYYFFYITDTKAVYEEEKQCHKEFSTFEETCEEAIKYCLENLI